MKYGKARNRRAGEINLANIHTSYLGLFYSFATPPTSLETHLNYTGLGESTGPQSLQPNTGSCRITKKMLKQATESYVRPKMKLDRT